MGFTEAVLCSALLCTALRFALFVGHGLVAHYKILVVHDDDQILDEIALLVDVVESAVLVDDVL